MVLKLWRMQIFETKSIVFKSLAISKIVRLSLLLSVPNDSIEELIKIQNFYETSQPLKSSIRQLKMVGLRMLMSSLK